MIQLNTVSAINLIMTEFNIIKRELARNGNRAFNKAKSTSGAYIMRGNSIVHVTSDGSIQVVKRTNQVRVRIKESDKIVVIK